MAKQLVGPAREPEQLLVPLLPRGWALPRQEFREKLIISESVTSAASDSRPPAFLITVHAVGMPAYSEGSVILFCANKAW